MSRPADRPDAPGELERLRDLVGPTESSYAELRDQLDAARAAVRDAELENGRLRGRITEMELELHRARQDQFHLQRVALAPVRRVVHAVRRLRR